MSSDRFQKLFSVVTWYLVCLVFNLYRFVWGGVPKAVFCDDGNWKGWGFSFAHISEPICSVSFSKYLFLVYMIYNCTVGSTL
jgi:hypothetical protein